MAGYYDLVLGLIPLALIGVTAALTVVGVSTTAAVPFGAVIAIGLIGHAMFVNGPIEAAGSGRDARTGNRRQPPINAD